MGGINDFTPSSPRAHPTISAQTCGLSSNTIHRDSPDIDYAGLRNPSEQKRDSRNAWRNQRRGGQGIISGFSQRAPTSGLTNRFSRPTELKTPPYLLTARIQTPRAMLGRLKKFWSHGACQVRSVTESDAKVKEIPTKIDWRLLTASSLDFQKGIFGFVPGAEAVIPAAAKAVECARKKHYQIIHVGLGFSPGQPEFSVVDSPFKRVKQNNLFVKGTPSAEFPQSQSPAKLEETGGLQAKSGRVFGE